MVESAQHYIQRMQELLDQLIQASEKLRDASRQVISEEELAPLQKNQEKILIELEQIDQKLHQYHRAEIDEKTHQEFHDKLQRFQLLNEEFIGNLRNSHGLIQFEMEHAPKEESEELLWHRLSHMPFMQNHSEMTKPPEEDTH